MEELVGVLCAPFGMNDTEKNNADTEVYHYY